MNGPAAHEADAGEAKGRGEREPTEDPGGGRRILHVDMDAFFASVEVREDPSLRGRPVIVGADPRGGKGRGVVAAASYEAREFGVHSAMPISEAYRRCPDAAFLRPRGELYRDVSRKIFAILKRYTDLVEPLSIDEAFLDVTASEELFGRGEEIARTIRREIREEESLTASVGVASSKFVAKVASDLEKPDGLVVVPEGEERRFLAPLEIDQLWGAGPRAQARFRELGVETIGDVASLSFRELRSTFGDASARRFHRLSRGVDPRPVKTERDRKSMGKEYTFGEDVEERRVVEARLLSLCEKMARRLRSKGLAGSTITVKLRWEDFETVTRQTTRERPVDTVEGIWPTARTLLRQADRPDRKVRLVGVYVSGFDADASGQLALFESQDADESGDQRVARAVDHLAQRFGDGAVTRAAILRQARRSADRSAGRQDEDSGASSEQSDSDESTGRNQRSDR